MTLHLIPRSRGKLDPIANRNCSTLGCQTRILLDSSEEGERAPKKIIDLYLKEAAENSRFRVLTAPPRNA